MTRAAKTVYYHGIYMIVLAVGFLLIPNMILSTIGLPETQEVWIRAIGMLLGIYGCFHILAAKEDVKPFFVWSVYGRASVLVFLIGFVAFGLVSPLIIPIGVIDLLSAFLTQRAIDQDHEIHEGSSLPSLSNNKAANSRSLGLHGKS